MWCDKETPQDCPVLNVMISRLAFSPSNVRDHQHITGDWANSLKVWEAGQIK